MGRRIGREVRGSEGICREVRGTEAKERDGGRIEREEE